MKGEGESEGGGGKERLYSTQKTSREMTNNGSKLTQKENASLGTEHVALKYSDVQYGVPLTLKDWSCMLTYSLVAEHGFKHTVCVSCL